MTLLHQLGRFTLLKQSADLIRYGLADAECVQDEIVLRMSQRSTMDHVLDRLDAINLRQKCGDGNRARRFEAIIEQHRVRDLDTRIAALVFPWETRQGTTVGYDADPDLDRHFEALVTETAIEWRDEAGIHPDADIGGVSGAVLTALVLLLTSFRLKHIRFVQVGMSRVANANYHMSPTIRKNAAEFRASVADISGLSMDEVRRALDLLTPTRAKRVLPR
jgi:hypothetical protein